MSMRGRVINVKYDEPLTYDDGGDEWTGKYKWDEATKTYLVVIKFPGEDAYLGWDENMEIVSTDSEYWWNLFTTEGKLAFRVPNKSGSSEGFYTLHTEADLSMILKYHVGNPTDAQLWTLSDPVNE
ncbi:hypothetical protein F4604DRAFT_1681929 [Suillus subluteus]|nr:hypothetical protein F4604DRAFT_1681929 [Suillus subluteus]